MHYERELSAALEAVDKAGRAILELYGPFKAMPDAPADVSTEADKRSQEIILDHLAKVFAGDAFCAEEMTPQLARAPQTGSRMWVVDPIDGTRGFARKNGEFSVMVGFVQDGRPALGIVAEPALDRLTYAVRGQGCFRRDGGAGQPLRCQVSQTRELSAARLVQSRSHKGGPPSPELTALAPAEVVETYSAGIKLAKVARAEVDVYLNTYTQFHDWDICAGQILVEEAGGRVTGLGGQELRYGLPGAWQKFGLLATNGHIHEAGLVALSGISK